MHIYAISCHAHHPTGLKPQPAIGLGDPLWRSLRVAEYHQDGTSMCPSSKVEVATSVRSVENMKKTKT